MLLNGKTLEGIAAGTISVAYRKWRRPTVKPGGTLLTAIGQLSVEEVALVDPTEITETSAQLAGFTTLALLHRELAQRSEGDVYRVRLSLAGPDPRIALREAVPDRVEVQEIRARLGRLDARGTTGPWTRRLLALVRDRPAERAGALAEAVAMEKSVFKRNVRKLKALGLTESLEIGYRLSPRGLFVLERLLELDGPER